MTRSAKIAITSLVALLLITAFFLGRAIWHNAIWKLHVDSLTAGQAFSDARKQFLRGRKILYEIQPAKGGASYEGKVDSNGDTFFSGRREGDYEIWYLFQITSFGEPNRYCQEEYVKLFNQHMKFIYEHPDEFDACGQRVTKKVKL